MTQRNLPKDMRDGKYSVHTSWQLDTHTGLVTTVATRTATLGQLFVLRWPSSTHSLYVKYIGARFTCTTAYGTAQRTGCELILAHSFTVNATDGTAVDMGSTVAHTNKLYSGFGTSKLTAGCVRVATTDGITSGTQTLDANAIGSVIGWTGAIGDQAPTAGSGAAGGFGTLFDEKQAGAPLKFDANQGFHISNYILMGATGVGVWDFLVIADEGIAE